MHATFNGIPKALMAVLGPLAALGLLLSVQGCSTTASATTSVTGPTPASALGVFNSYVTAEKVALANDNELLALSLTSSAQYTVTSSAYASAEATGGTVTGPVYGRPTLYVPKLTTYPLWFIATAPERPATGGPAGTAVMVFDRPDAETTWALDGTVLLSKDAPALNVAVNQAGYATALATTDTALSLRPDVVGAIHATVADDGPSSPAAAAVVAGPLTTGIYTANAAIGRQAAAHGESYSWEMEGTSYPIFALRTTDGGALVFYTMTLNTTTSPAHPNSKVQPPIIPVPAAYKGLLAVGAPAPRHNLTADSTVQYLTIDPPATAKAAKIQVIGSGGGPSYAHSS